MLAEFVWHEWAVGRPLNPIIKIEKWRQIDAASMPSSNFGERARGFVDEARFHRHPRQEVFLIFLLGRPAFRHNPIERAPIVSARHFRFIEAGSTEITRRIVALLLTVDAQFLMVMPEGAKSNKGSISAIALHGSELRDHLIGDQRKSGRVLIETSAVDPNGEPVEIRRDNISATAATLSAADIYRYPMNSKLTAEAAIESAEPADPHLFD